MSNLPKLAQLEFNEEDLTSTSVSRRVHAAFDWDFGLGDFKLRDGRLIPLEGKEYLKVWIQLALRTEKHTQIYEESNFGSEHHLLIGTTFKPSLTKSEYERMIREALMQNEAITNVSNFSFDQTESRMTISFDVDSIFGTHSEGVTI